MPESAPQSPPPSPAPPGSAGIAERVVRKMLAGNGVEINGPNAWDPQINHPAFYRRVLFGGSLGLGESYVDGWWQCEQLDEMFCRLLRSPRIINYAFIAYAIPYLRNLLTNLQKKTRAFQVGEAHYDISNDLYAAMLDKRMAYTCGYWAGVDNLDHAQQQKLEMSCRKLDLKPGMRVLDIGCGWGSFAHYAAENHGVEVVGVTISGEQVKLAAERCRHLPVQIKLLDYRDITGQFDAIASLGMFEHVGHKNHRAYMRAAWRCLKQNGRFLLHTIGKNNSRLGVDPWIGKYIFPNGEIPSLKYISASLESLMIIEDLHNFGADYDKTLMAWLHNFQAAWPRLQGRMPEQFLRVWSYYLRMCAGAFRARDLHLWQLVISKGEPGSIYRRPNIFDLNIGAGKPSGP